MLKLVDRHVYRHVCRHVYRHWCRALRSPPCSAFNQTLRTYFYTRLYRHDAYSKTGAQNPIVSSSKKTLLFSAATKNRGSVWVGGCGSIGESQPATAGCGTPRPDCWMWHAKTRLLDVARQNQTGGCGTPRPDWWMWHAKTRLGLKGQTLTLNRHVTVPKLVTSDVGSDKQYVINVIR